MASHAPVAPYNPLCTPTYPLWPCMEIGDGPLWPTQTYTFLTDAHTISTGDFHFSRLMDFYLPMFHRFILIWIVQHISLHIITDIITDIFICY